MSEELLFKEYDQQYQQYRHLDNLRERYIAFYIAFVTAVFVVVIKETPSNQTQLVLLFLFIIGIFISQIAISIRITQRLTADHLMEIRKALLRSLPSSDAKKWVCNSYLKITYKPHKKDPCVQSGWNWKESAIQLIWLLIAINSFIGTYLIKIKWQIKWPVCCLSCVFVVLIIIQVLFFIWRFKTTFSEEAQTKREKEMHDYLRDVCDP